MSDVTDWNVFEKMIQKILRSALNELGELVNDKVRASIDEHVYVGRNEYYLNGSSQPSYEFRESYESSDVTISPNNPQVLIKSNPENMTTDLDNFKHGSNYNRNGDADIREYLPEILAFNLSGNFFGVNQWWHNRDSYFYDVLDKLKAGGWLNKEFKRLLQKRGLDVK